MTSCKPGSQFEGRVLSVAGLDPSGGAGLLADIKTISMHGCYGAGVVSAMTVQNTCGVSHVEPVDGDIVQAQIKAVLDDMGMNAIKLGMLHNEGMVKIISTVLTELKARDEKYILVLDPVIRSSSGAEMLSKAGVTAMTEQLFPLTTVLTPNIPEAEILAGMSISSKEQMLEAGEKIMLQGVENVLITGGHLAGEGVVDVLLTQTGASFFESEKIDAPDNHGTGCALSTSLACHLSLGEPVEVAAEKAISFVQQALKNTIKIGQGNGPINIDGYRHD